MQIKILIYDLEFIIMLLFKLGYKVEESANDHCSMELLQNLPSVFKHNGMKHKSVWFITAADWSALTWRRLPSAPCLWCLSPLLRPLFKVGYVSHPYLTVTCTAIHHMYLSPTFSILSCCFHKMMKGLWKELLLLV